MASWQVVELPEISLQNDTWLDGQFIFAYDCPTQDRGRPIFAGIDAPQRQFFYGFARSMLVDILRFQDVDVKRFLYVFPFVGYLEPWFITPITMVFCW